MKVKSLIEQYMHLRKLQIKVENMFYNNDVYCQPVNERLVSRLNHLEQVFKNDLMKGGNMYKMLSGKKVKKILGIEFIIK